MKTNNTSVKLPQSKLQKGSIEKSKKKKGVKNKEKKQSVDTLLKTTVETSKQITLAAANKESIYISSTKLENLANFNNRLKRDAKQESSKRPTKTRPSTAKNLTSDQLGFLKPSEIVARPRSAITATNRNDSTLLLPNPLPMSPKLVNLNLLEEVRHRALTDTSRIAIPRPTLQLDELPNEVFTWHKSKRRSVSAGKSRQIDILGCLMPIELIFARADERMRQQRKVSQARNKVKFEKLEATLVLKNKRESVGDIREMKQQQIQLAKSWLTLICICRYLHSFKEEVFPAIRVMRKIQWGLKVKKAFLSWYYRRYFRKYKFNVTKAFGAKIMLFRVNIRIHRKRKAVTMMKKFLNDYKIYANSANKTISKYIKSVRYIQLKIRDYQSSRAGQIDAVSKIWIQIERKNLKKWIKELERKKNKLRGVTINLSSLNALEQKEMKLQDIKWRLIDDRIQSQITNLKASKAIEAETLDDKISRLMISTKLRRFTINRYISQLRRDFYLEQRYNGAGRKITKSNLDSDQMFGSDDAYELLTGTGKNVFNKYISAKFDKKLARVVVNPFRLFKTLKASSLEEIIVKIHTERQTVEREYVKCQL